MKNKSRNGKPSTKLIGRPTDLNDKIKSIALGLAEKGKTMAEIADTLKISRTTLYNWFGDDKDFMNTIKSSARMADDLVEASLYHRAQGYSHESEKIFYDSERGKAIRVKTIKHYAPDPTAMIFWLKNRQPDRWREKPPEDDPTTEVPIVIAKDEQDL